MSSKSLHYMIYQLFTKRKMNFYFLLQSTFLTIYQRIRILHTQLPSIKLYGKSEFHVLVSLQLENTNIKILKIWLQFQCSTIV